MKATGIVRRIDDLGRVVIPKEIRRTMRIREGAPLEIYTDRDGEVIFKKYSPVGELSGFSAQYAEAINKTLGLPVVITDRDATIATAGVPKRDYAEKPVTTALDNVMERRALYSYKKEDLTPIHVVDGQERETVLVAAPVLAEGDVIGCVTILSGEQAARAGEVEIKMAQAAALFLGKQLEE
ncbi:stage V sporulation T C-terminal domain-containing protein [Feifania hominis]|uniref:AbrB/MazE/SpoVT family DNA-binding domain-containing protein n=1 Tax=Feifania hominis TaxID=2763660 RepID=A0A926DF05_9FIRM|nr:stage V sporulation T C-terminal domain-containing protein [Feifania hominis]MBC8536636.1 AbrB/MazE/SpoVT family DNA-binding domain-containing protein [Feifania hominis]